METGPRFIVPSDGLEKPGIEPATPGLQVDPLEALKHSKGGSMDDSQKVYRNLESWKL